MIARNMAPGLRRTFSFEEWNWMDDRLIHEVRQEASRKNQSRDRIGYYGN